MSPTVLLTNFGIILSSSSIGNTSIFTSILRLGFGIFRHCFLFDDERKVVISIYDAFMTRLKVEDLRIDAVRISEFCPEFRSFTIFEFLT